MPARLVYHSVCFEKKRSDRQRLTVCCQLIVPEGPRDEVKGLFFVVQGNAKDLVLLLQLQESTPSPSSQKHVPSPEIKGKLDGKIPRIETGRFSSYLYQSRKGE